MFPLDDGTFNIKYENCLQQSTYHGKKWWGDILSDKYLDGINKNFKNNYNKNNFYNNDILCIEQLLSEIIDRYNYPLRSKNNKSYYFLPIKYEVKLGLIYIYKFKIFYLLNLLKFYFKRIQSINKKRIISKYPISLG